MTVLNLPRHLRYKRENIILIGIIPGQHEPKNTINSFLKPLVDELLQLWAGVYFNINTPSGKRNKMIKAAIMCVTCDIPAGRKTCGFLGHSATFGCSKCRKKFPGGVGQKDYSGFDRSEWEKRTNEDHRKDVDIIKNFCTKTEQEEAESKYGCRYSCLLELPYFDAPRMLCIDIMHNLFLGTGKHMISVWVKQQWLTKNHLESVQQFIDKIHLPSDVGRIPLKIASGFAGFTADQFKTWITIYSIPALFTILPTEQLECWRHFVLACRILCKQALSRDDIDLADCLLMRFCNKVEILYGKEVITPNMHLHGHIKEMLLDYGPSQELWLFSFERYNGFLGKQPTNNRAIEPQLMRRFLQDNFARSLPYPQLFKDELAKFDITDRTVGSVNETLTSHSFLLPPKHTRKVLNVAKLNILKKLYCKLHSNTQLDDIIINSVIMQYSSVTLKGKNFSTSRKKNIPYVVQAQWDDDLFGPSPSPIVDSYLPTTNIRPVDIKYYFKATFVINDSSSSLTFAHVQWFLPHQQRYALGKPVEFWHDRMYECDGFHSFIPVNNILCRCAHGIMPYNRENLMFVIPLVE